MGRSEAPSNMPEDTELGFTRETHGTPASPVTESPSILSRIRKGSLPIITATGILFGGLVDQQRPVSAQEPQPPAAGDEGEYAGGSIYLPSLQGGKKVEPGATPTNQSDRPTRTPSPTATRTPTSSPTAPERTPTVPATSTPTETATPTPTPTETSTPTEAGPLTELALKQGDPLIIAGDSPTLKYALVGKNGDEESGAAAAGYDFASMQNPVLDGSGKYVVGTVIKDGNELTIRVPTKSLDPQILERIQQGNPEEDERLGATVTLWAGRGGKEKTLVANALGGDGLGSFIGNYDTGADFHIQASASGTAKTGTIDFLTQDQPVTARQYVRLSSDLKGTWSILNGLQDPNTGNIIGGWTILHTFPKGESDLKFTIKGDQLVLPSANGQEAIQRQIPHPLRNGLTSSYVDHTGTQKSQAFIEVQKAEVRFLEVAPEEPVGGPEFTAPTLAEVVTETGNRLLVRPNSLPKPADQILEDHATNIFDFFDNSDYPTEEQTNYFDKDKPMAIVLDVGMSDTDLLQIITDNPNSTFQYGPQGTSRGPVGTVFAPDGTLTKKQQVRKMLAAVRANGSEVLLNTNVSPDMTLARVAGVQTDRLSTMMRALEELKALGAGQETTLMLAGDSEYIDTKGMTQEEAVEALRYALKAVQEAGVKAGLGNIVGPGDPNMASDTEDGVSSRFYRLIGEATVKLNGVTLGFNYNLSPYNWDMSKGGRMWFFSTLPNEKQTRERQYTYSTGAIRIKDIFQQETLLR